jgi:hypothetical protein
MGYLGGFGNSADKILSPLGINLEREGLGAFGDFVDNNSKIQAFRNLGLSAPEAEDFLQVAKPGEFNVGSPAMSNIQISPKQKFLFQVQFFIDPKVFDEVKSGVSELTLAKFGFFVKQIDRPKVEYTYEDINMYNVRTRVLTRVNHQPLNISLWDDARNTVGEFVNLYRRAHTPSARQNEYIGGNIEESGFTFSTGILDPSARDFSTRVALPGNAKHFLREVKISQVYSTHSSHQAHAFEMTVYRFFNPVIKAFDFDDVNHETGESNGVSMQIDYDSLYIEDYEVASIIKDTELPDYYHFIPGKSIRNNLNSLSGATRATKGGGIIPGNGLNLLDEARRALTSGNPLSYVKERAVGILRNGDPGLDFKGVSGYASDAIGGAARSLYVKATTPDYTDIYTDP